MFNYNLVVLSITIILLGNHAFAGAWLKKKGESELFSQFEYKTLIDYYVDPSDNQRYLSKIFSFELYSLFYQYGLNDNNPY